MRDVQGKHTRVHLLSAFLRAKDPIDKRERSEYWYCVWICVCVYVRARPLSSV